MTHGCINIKDLPALTSVDTGLAVNMPNTVGEHLRMLVENHHATRRHAKSLQIKLVLPTMTELAEYFNCSTMDVYDGLRHMLHYGYRYQLDGIDCPLTITLADPVNAKCQPSVTVENED